MYINVFGTYNKPSTAYHALSEFAKSGGQNDQLLLLSTDAAAAFYSVPHDVPEEGAPEDALVLEPVETAYWSKLLQTVSSRTVSTTAANAEDADLKDIIHMYRPSLDANRILFVVKQDVKQNQ